MAARAARWAVASGCLFALSASLAPFAGSADASAPAVAAAASSQVTKSVDAARVHLVNGADVVADPRTITVSVDLTTGLRDGQPINVSWTGAHPTGGVALDPNGSLAASLEYPVVILECRGVSGSSATGVEQISPETCYTQTPDQRYFSTNDIWSPFRLDRYSPAAARSFRSGVLDPIPAACLGSLLGLDHWVPFRAVDDTLYYGGPGGCAGLAPEATSEESSVPPNTTFARTDLEGTGSAKFVISTEDSNASLGCSYQVACSLVVVPVMGISCDVAGAALPAADQPPVKYGAFFFQRCSSTGNFDPTIPRPVNPGDEDPAVSGRLWWTESNWRNRMTFPLTFAKPASVCGVVSAGAPTLLYGSETLRQATSQWAPKFCTDPKLFTFRHVMTGEPQAKNLVGAGSISAAIAAGPPSEPFSKPVVQAPIALTGFAITFAIDDPLGQPITSLRLNPRLLAKLLTQSYSGNQTISSEYQALHLNPLSLASDREFRALNPDPVNDSFSTDVASTLFTVSSDSDVIRALTSYINADPEARAWLDGKPDPWGTVVNPSYKGIALPVDGWPQLDAFISPRLTDLNPCLAANPVPWLPLVAAPVSDPAVVALNMQYGIGNSQLVCKNPGENNQKLAAAGRQRPGSRFILGVVSLADAARYQIRAASLQSHITAVPAEAFADATGRTFVAPSSSSLSAAAALLVPDKALGTWVVPYATLRGATGIGAYPGLLLVSLDVPTVGLSTHDATRLSTFLRWVVSDGQTPGPENGQLPAGYVPLKASAAGALLATYSRNAADAIAAQQGYVPTLDGSSKPPGPSPTPTPSPSATPTPSPSPTRTRTPSPSVEPTVTPIPTPSSSPTASPTPSPTDVALVKTGVTTPVSAGPIGQALPALLALALFAGLGAIATTLWGRR